MTRFRFGNAYTVFLAPVFAMMLAASPASNADTDIALSKPYSIPQGVNGNEQTYDNQHFQVLTTYDELRDKLENIQRKKKNWQIDVGPLILNGDNGGLVDIDVPLDPALQINLDVCGAGNLNPTVREAVVCTVNDGVGGNTDGGKVGFSTQNRELLAVRMGNEEGIKVLVIAQQHGNEVQSTEAVLRVINNMANSRSPGNRDLLDRLNILFLVRANPDGGEPLKDCFIGTPLGAVIEQDCALTRTNVDPMAGGFYERDSEPDFSGVVGVGYNLNRYHYVDLFKPIRPVETQAMVATGLAWSPEVILDLHGDISKTSCDIDFATLAFIPMIGLPSAQCVEGSDQSPVVLSPFEFTDAADSIDQVFRSRTLAARIAHRVEASGFGVVNRFAQIQTGTGQASDGTVDNYKKIGALVAGWESHNFLNAVTLSVQGYTDGVPQLGLTPEWFLGNRMNGVNNRMNQVALEEALEVIGEWRDAEPIDDADYCDIPLTTGVKAALPEEIFGSVPGYGPYLVPLIGPLLQVFDNCPNNP